MGRPKGSKNSFKKENIKKRATFRIDQRALKDLETLKKLFPDETTVGHVEEAIRAYSAVRKEQYIGHITEEEVGSAI